MEWEASFEHKKGDELFKKNSKYKNGIEFWTMYFSTARWSGKLLLRFKREEKG